MIWIFAAVVLVLAVLSPRFRKIGLGLAGAVILIIVILIVINERDKPNPAPVVTDSKAAPTASHKMMDHDEYVIEMKDKEDPGAKNRIPLGELKFAQIQAIPGQQSGTVQSIQARLYNESKRFTLTDYAYYLVVQDCISSDSRDKASEECTTVYDQRSRGIPLAIPPDQARDITIAIPTNPATFSAPFKLLGKARIELTPTDARAYRSSEHPQPPGSQP